jgi:hypothetical protein
MAERTSPAVMDALNTIAAAIGAIGITTRLAAQNSKEAKEAAQRTAAKMRKGGAFDVLSGRMPGDENAQSITRLLRGEAEQRYRQPMREPEDLGLREPEEERSGFFSRAFRRRRRRRVPTYWREQTEPQREEELETVETARERTERNEQKEQRRTELQERLGILRKRKRPTYFRSSAAQQQRERMMDFAKQDVQRKEQVEQLAAGRNPFEKPTFFKEFVRGWSTRRAAQNIGLKQAIRGIAGMGRSAAAGGGAAATEGAGVAAGGGEALAGAATVGAGAAEIIPVVGTIAAMGVAVVTVTKLLQSWANELVDSRMEMARYNGVMATNYAYYLRSQQLNLVHAGAQEAPSYSRLTESTMEFNRTMQPFLSDLASVKNDVVSGLEMMATNIVEGIASLDVAKAIHQWINRNDEKAGKEMTHPVLRGMELFMENPRLRKGFKVLKEGEVPAPRKIK